MEFYSRCIFPLLCHWAMSHKPMTECRAELLANARGEVLEIGFGTGLNLAHYPDRIKHISAIDANPGMCRGALKRIAEEAIDVDLRILSCEKLPFQSRRFDTVVSTWTLCSVADVQAALGEVRRVLKSDGVFLFAEHGLSDDPAVQRWQNRLNPLQKRIGDGCHLNRDMQLLINGSGFEFLELRKFYLEKVPRIGGFIYQGRAAKSA
ncbi:MAG: class I SAM-dependent methyltransferase [Burkholderiales bacterium]